MYRTCGLLILAAIVVALATSALATDVHQTLQPMLWCETVAVSAFGTAWVAKSDAILRVAKLPDVPPSDEGVGQIVATGSS
ncbi:hypothetical protein GCM10027614_61470 [Micromonospora vulcania]